MRKRKTPLRMVVWQCPRTGRSELRLRLSTWEDPRVLGLHGLVRWLAYATGKRVDVVLSATGQVEWWEAWVDAFDVASQHDMDLRLRWGRDG
jgi:hypothetical protein